MSNKPEQLPLFELEEDWKKEMGCGYGIRIKTGFIVRGITRSESYDYFDLDETGLIIASPRGYAKEFNKKVRITDMPKMVEKYKEWRINE